jgi:acyl-coenzyme A synthetase/AMP-(fatty) acid ligase
MIEFRSELPKTPVGKILRRELRAAEVGQALPPTKASFASR